MDVEKLINIIYEKKPLWDMTDKSYHMRDIQRKLWQEVATEMSGQVDELKTKWRGLRDTFRKEFNKSKKQKSGDGAESVVTSKWAYYKMLLFLSKTVERRKLHGNVSPQKENDNKSDSETESTLEVADNRNSQSTIQESSQQISNTDIQQPSTSGTKATKPTTAEHAGGTGGSPPGQTPPGTQGRTQPDRPWGEAFSDNAAVHAPPQGAFQPSRRHVKEGF
ncbi:hypothetical protein NQ318_023227 [Aromia moschata]|uniref:MADF domain-containing protein n=2 Tax=Aromia moschata TaxID=1265417 RepID=A0AAV8XLJ2_9CUCU|nr:hypothetical protein NQ318_023227 [Aromia moschata]